MVLRLKSLAGLRAKPREARPKRKRKLPGPKESEVVRDVGLYLATLSGRFWRTNAGTVFVARRRIALAPVGTADYVGVLGAAPGVVAGRFCAVECKRPKGGKLSEAQRGWQSEIRALGGLVVETACSCWDVFHALRAAGYAVPEPDPRLL